MQGLEERGFLSGRMRRLISEVEPLVARDPSDRDGSAYARALVTAAAELASSHTPTRVAPPTPSH